MRIPVNAPPCPKCGRTMRAHCARKCGWLFCGICALTMHQKTGKVIKKTYGELPSD